MSSKAEAGGVSEASKGSKSSAQHIYVIMVWGCVYILIRDGEDRLDWDWSYGGEHVQASPQCQVPPLHLQPN